MDGTANGNGLQVYALQVGRATLEEKVLAFRATIRRESQADSDALPTMAAELYDLLVAPAEDLAAASQRLLLSPDGPLHTLPFNALLRDLPDGKTQYLIQWKPMHTVLSATLYRELRRNRENPPAGLTNNQGLDSPRAITMTAFGDPRYPAGAAGEGDTATLDEITRGRRELQPLPWSRTEVKQIAALFPEDHARTYLGPRATEDAVMSATSSTRLVHFACHAILDERFPLNSALVLSIPAPWSEGQPNGLLQSWEIFESLRLDADLVTLSGCDTALGAQVEGEGLSSLSRAFLHAGAQSVLASLWSVADQSTAELMTRFYTHLQGGKTKDEALQAAQIDLLRGAVQTDTSSGRGVSRLARTGNPSTHPFYWAAFQLIGDWR
jgi:CHAT domain-containing protein